MSKDQQAPVPAPERTDYRKLVDRDFMGSWDLSGPDGKHFKAVVQIEDVRKYVPRERKRVKTGEIGPDGKPIFEPEKLKRLRFKFVGKRKEWLAGPVSQDVIASMFGPVIQDWKGKRITLYFDPAVKFGRKTTGGIRVWPKSPDANAALTEDPMDNAVDENRAAELDEAAAEFEAGGEEEASP